MSETHSEEFKAKVVLEAASGEQGSLSKIAGEYEVTPAQIVEWAAGMDLPSEDLYTMAREAGVDPDDLAMDVELTSGSKRFLDSISYGVTPDVINMKKLGFWTTFGAGFVLLIVLALMGIYQFTTAQTIQQVLESSGSHYEVTQLKAREQQRLNSFGVVDADQEIYRVPIDQVIEQMARDAEEQ
ncbi:MAG: hypothetical protein WD315_00695 [Balneolaceae bacterium]